MMNLRIILIVMAACVVILVAGNFVTQRQSEMNQNHSVQITNTLLQQDSTLRTRILAQLVNIANTQRAVRETLSQTQDRVGAALALAEKRLFNDQRRQAALLKSIRSQVSSLPAPNGKSLNTKKSAQVTVREDLVKVLPLLKPAVFVRAIASPLPSSTASQSASTASRVDVSAPMAAPRGFLPSRTPAQTTPTSAVASPTPQPKRCHRFLGIKTTGCR